MKSEDYEANPVRNVLLVRWVVPGSSIARKFHQRCTISRFVVNLCNFKGGKNPQRLAKGNDWTNRQGRFKGGSAPAALPLLQAAAAPAGGCRTSV